MHPPNFTIKMVTGRCMEMTPRTSILVVSDARQIAPDRVAIDAM